MQKIFHWTDDFYTHVRTVDEQHMKLVEIINRLSQISFNFEHVFEADLEKVKKDLLKYIDTHFSSEEQMMESAGIDSRHLAVHKQNHRLFATEVSGFLADCSGENTGKMGNIVEYLIKWLAYHILNIDKSMARQLSKINEGVSAEEAYDSEEKYQESSSEPLLKALRALFEIISQKNEELKEANSNLEEKIRLRTRELEETNKRLNLLAIRDELTGLSNRRFAELSINQLLKTRDRYDTPFSVLLIDADKFKSVNDTYGHDIGDKVIQWISDHLQENTRKSDIVCRIGGDEFLVICPNTDLEGACDLGEKNSAIGMKELVVDGKTCWKPSLSIGAAEAADDIDDINSLLKKADTKMYEVKKRGGSGVAG